jgi:hypothetical protein
MAVTAITIAMTVIAAVLVAAIGHRRRYFRDHSPPHLDR